jgi:hypothetical protein
MHHPVQARMGRVDARTPPPGVQMRPRIRAIQASTGLVSPSHKWLLCRLVNGSAREPTKDVPSCDKPGGPARRGRTRDFRMGIPTAIASRNGERPELKHLSRGRKRTRNAMSSVTAGERDTAQTEACAPRESNGQGQCGVRADNHRRNAVVKSPEMGRETG